MSGRIITAKAVSGAIFPLDEAWGLGTSVYSPQMSQQMVWLSAHMAYEHAQAAFARLAHRSIPSTSIWRETQTQGERLRAYQAQQHSQVSPERVVLADARADHAQLKGASLDGGMVNLRGEGWKEFKIGAIYDVVLKASLDPQTLERVDLPSARDIAYTAVLGDVEQFAPALWALAVAHDFPQAANSCITADGAAWIWNVVADYFPDSVQIVDWFHACQHLAQAANMLFGENALQASAWKQAMQAPLFEGQVWQIIQALDKAALSDLALYFKTHQRRMRYQEFRENGYPIGSGTVESGVKQFKARLTGPGMRWSRPAAVRMFVLRAAVLDDSFDNLWAAA